jgi:hypothetical protein
MSRFTKLSRIILVGVFLLADLFYFNFTKAIWSDHLVISEVQTSGGSGHTTNDFIELYNPAPAAFNIGGWKVHKRTQSGAESSIKVFSTGKLIPAHGYFLWGNSSDGYNQTISADESSTSSIADNNSIGLLSADDVLIDALAWGTGLINPFIEGDSSSTPANLEPSKSLERKPGASGGNGEDSNNNLNDFFVQTAPNPQNSQTSSTPPIVDFVCGNGVCESGENQNNCPSDCGTSNFGGGGSSYISYEIQPGDILINEIFPEPDLAKNEKEWIEFYNTTDRTIDFSSWTIEDNTLKPVTLKNFILAPHQYQILSSDDFVFSLNNSGDILILKKNSTIIDQVAYGDFEDGNLDDNAPRPGKSSSIGRRNESPADTNNDKNDFFLSLIVTPGQLNNLNSSSVNQGDEAPTSPKTTVFISEFLPNPQDSAENEWVEFYNSSINEVDISNWQLDDSEGGSRAYILPVGTKIAAQSYLVLNRQQTKIILNNTFDSVRFIRPDKTIQEQVDYNDPPKGASYAKNDFGVWSYTNNPTQGLTNIFCSDDEENSSGANLDQKDIDSGYSFIETADLSNLSENDKIIFQGVVTATPNMFAKTYFYLNGLQVYSSRGDFPPLAIGDLVEVKGLLSSTLSQHRIKIKQPSDLTIIASHQLVDVKSVAIGELNEELIGALVKIHGQLIDKQGNKFFIDDGNDETIVSISSKVNIDKKLFKEGQEIVAQGILLPEQDGWKILPRFNSDLNIQIDNPSSETVSAAASFETKAARANNLFASVGGLWLKLAKGQIIKYSILSAAVIILLLFGLFIRLRRGI